MISKICPIKIHNSIIVIMIFNIRINDSAFELVKTWMVIMAILFISIVVWNHVNKWRDKVEVHEAIRPPCLVFPKTVPPHKCANITIIVNKLLIIESLKSFLQPSLTHIIILYCLWMDIYELLKRIITIVINVNWISIKPRSYWNRAIVYQKLGLAKLDSSTT